MGPFAERVTRLPIAFAIARLGSARYADWSQASSP